MTVHSRRYGRWCREHFDIHPEDECPDGAAGQAVEATTKVDAAEAGIVQSGIVQGEALQGTAEIGDVAGGEPGRLN
ncbi:hypothetical protein [Amycolatopsis sp. lyj-112]|uniref:hypothetical protein n=1 Tax=Amycolatopsis sp. lyj-112 TaxID=2789288 RepID=UPI00397DD6E4